MTARVRMWVEWRRTRVERSSGTRSLLRIRPGPALRMRVVGTGLESALRITISNCHNRWQVSGLLSRPCRARISHRCGGGDHPAWPTPARKPGTGVPDIGDSRRR
jgi:hypothetical protein